MINYGLTKKMMAVQAQAYKKQYGLDSIHLILTNLYGPGDSYNPDRSHVVAALVRKWVEADMAKASSIEVWGTGNPGSVNSSTSRTGAVRDRDGRRDVR